MFSSPFFGIIILILHLSLSFSISPFSSLINISGSLLSLSFNPSIWINGCNCISFIFSTCCKSKDISSPEYRLLEIKNELFSIIIFLLFVENFTIIGLNSNFIVKGRSKGIFFTFWHWISKLKWI